MSSDPKFALGKDVPCTRPIERFGDIVVHPMTSNCRSAGVGRIPE